MGKAGQRFLTQLAVSAIVAIATPALAAALVVGASEAASAGSEGMNGAINPPVEAADINSGASPYIATHGPARLSALAGNDEVARQSVRSVHVSFARHPR